MASPSIVPTASPAGLSGASATRATVPTARSAFAPVVFVSLVFASFVLGPFVSALRAATEVNARFMSQGDEIGVLEPGRFADFIAWNGSPLVDIALLQDKSRLRGVYIAGREIKIADRPYDPRRVTDFSLSNWTDLYTRERVAQLRGDRRRLQAAE